MLETLSNTGLEVSKNLLSILGIFFAALGAPQCFFGYRLQKLYITAIGFLTGLLACTIGGFLMTKVVGPALLLGLLGGMLLGFLSFKLYRLATCLINMANAFLGTATLGFLMCFPDSLRELLGDPRVQGYYLEGIVVLSIAMALIIGVATAILLRPMIIFTTAFQGGVSLGFGLAMMLYLLDFMSISFLVLLCIALGTVFQFYNTRAEGLAIKRARRQAKAAAASQRPVFNLPKRYYIKLYSLFILLDGGMLLLCLPSIKKIHPVLWCLLIIGVQQLVIIPIVQAAIYQDWKRICPRQLAGVSRFRFMFHPINKFITYSESIAPADQEAVHHGME